MSLLHGRKLKALNAKIVVVREEQEEEDDRDFGSVKGDRKKARREEADDSDPDAPKGKETVKTTLSMAKELRDKLTEIIEKHENKN